MTHDKLFHTYLRHYTDKNLKDIAAAYAQKPKKDNLEIVLFEYPSSSINPLR